MDGSRSVLHERREKLWDNRYYIALTTNNHRVVPPFFEPFSSCMVAPDPLFSGHFRDLLTVGLNLLPPSSRIKFEKSIIKLMKLARKKTENRLLDAKNTSTL